MAQTPDGYLWFGTFSGLVRFDGVKFTVFDRGNTPELPSAGVVNLHLDRRGWLWVSTLKGTAVLAEGKWRTFGTNDGWAGNYVRTFSERRNGDLLLTTFDGAVLEFVNGRLSQLPPPPGRPGSGYLGQVDAVGQWWVVQFHFIGRWDGQRWEQTVAPPTVNASVDKLGLAASRDGGMWLFLTNSVRKYRGGSEVSRLELPEPLHNVWCISEDSRSNLWICTSLDGIRRVSPAGEVRGWSTTNGLAKDSTRFVFEDRENNLWVGTSGGGLQRFKPRRFRGLGIEGRASPPVVSSVSPSAAGDVWVATDGDGLFRWTDSRATKVVLPHQPESTSDINYVRSVIEDRLGRVWVGTNRRGLWLFDKGGPHLIPAADAGGENVTTLFEDSRGRVWLAGGEAASVYEDGKIRVLGSQQGLPRGPVRCFGEDSRGVVWLAQEDGVFRFEDGRFVLLKDDTGSPLRNIGCLQGDASGAMWMGSYTRGLIRWREGKLATVGAASGLPVSAIYSIVEDRRAFWWMTSNAGVVRASLAELRAAAGSPSARIHCQVMDSSDGLPGSDFPYTGQPTVARDRAGRLWFATSKGVAVIDPEKFSVNQVPPPTSIEEVSYFLPKSGARNGGQMQLRPPFLEKVSLPPGCRRIEIHYSGLSLVAAEKVRFQFKLEGEDVDWHEVGTRRVAYYYDLPPREYVFRVRAANNDGIWNESGTSLALSLQPFLWQTWWFRIGAVVALVSLGSFVTGWRVHRRHQRELAELERTRLQQAEMAHLSRVSMLGELSGSLAHELNQPLTAILSNAQAAQRFLASEQVDLNELREILADIVEEDKRAGEVIRRLRLLFKKGEAQRLPLDLNDVVQEVLKLTRSDLLNQGVTAHTELAPELPAVLGDRVQLEQVLLNLVMNACDAMRETPAEQRRIVLRTEVVDGEAICVSLADWGRGVPLEQLENVFQPFFTTKGQGMGLGLSICRTIMSAHGGKLWAARNEAGPGAAFYFTLPIANLESDH